MNIWILLLSVLPYVSICIFVISLVWRYDHYYEDERKQPFTMMTIVSFPLFIIFIFTAPFIYLSLFENGLAIELWQWLKNIATLNLQYEVVVSSSFYTKVSILFLCVLILLLSCTSFFALLNLISELFIKKITSFMKFSAPYVKLSMIFIISFFNLTK